MLLDEMAEAMREFCNRVESGEVRSVRTYRQFKALLAQYDGPGFTVVPVVKPSEAPK